MTFCGVCGNQLTLEDMFCPNCGAKVESGYETTPSKATNTSVAYTQAQSNPNKAQYQTTSPQTPYYPNTPYQQSQPYQQNQAYGGYQTNQGYNQPYGYPYGRPIDTIAWWIYIVSFFVFPIGLYYYFSRRQEKPNSTKNLLIVTIIGMIFYFI